jgi:hypothetical protein
VYCEVGISSVNNSRKIQSFLICIQFEVVSQDGVQKERKGM